MNLLFLQYNSYYNRTIKQEESVDAYVENTWKSAAKTNINFQEGDLVDTTITVNWEFPWTPDYLVCYHTTADDIKILDHRWFVMESVRIRKDQFRLTLHRDLIVDNYDTILSAPMFIEKATVPATNPLIFNSESMTYNQIKKQEHLVSDKTGCAWLVGYFAANLNSAITSSFSLTQEKHTTIASSHTDWGYYKYVNSDLDTLGSVNNIKFRATKQTNILGYRTFHTYVRGVTKTDQWDDGEVSSGTLGFTLSEQNPGKKFDTFVKSVKPGSINWGTLQSELASTYENADATDLLQNYNGKIITFTDGNYKINVIKQASYNDTATDTSLAAISSLNTYIENALNSTGMEYTRSDPQLSIGITVIPYRVEMTLVSDQSGNYQYTMSNATALLQDAPYKMFAIPYPIKLDYCQVLNSTGTVAVTNKITSDLAIKWATDIATQLGSNLYDVQVLPYCPIINDIMGAIGYNATTKTRAARFTIPKNTSEGTDYMFLNEPSKEEESGYKPAGICFFPTKSTFSFTNYNFELEYTDHIVKVEEMLPLDTNVKVQSETQMCRLVSPNYNGSFEFNIAKNNGVHYFNIDCTYKPFSPYIQIAPDFGGLYGNDFNDARGLILNGDFSLPIVNDKWIEYEIQNKNYQTMFNRQIENMEVNNAIANQEALWQIGAGSLQGATSGAMTGGMAAGGFGAAAGAVIGGGASAAGGIMDYTNMQKRQAEAIDYTRDQFGYQLSNIKALPYGLTKVSALNAVSKYFPFIEVYECTDTEKSALENKIKYNGMTVMAIGKISDYQLSEPSYIKCKLIRLEDSGLEDHEINEIANELNRGVFI